MDHIRKIISPLFDTVEGTNEAATNIFLTMKGIRPACIPFDSEGNSDEILKKIIDNP